MNILKKWGGIIISSTNRGYARHKTDYYVTPQKDIKKFLSEFSKMEPQVFKGNILDCCAGGDENHEMSYPNALVDFGVSPDNITTVDIRKDSKAMIKEDYRKVKCSEDFDLIITNPPFKIARDIIEKAIQDVNDGGFVVMLLRLNYLGTQKRFDLWQNMMPKYIYVHHKRMSFTDDDKTDSIEYGHYCWKKGDYPEFSKIKVI